MAAMKTSSIGELYVDPVKEAASFQILDSSDLQSTVYRFESTEGLRHMTRLSLDGLLLKKTRAVCDRYKLEFAQLTTIQRKFLTHYRCNQCGLLPLYHVDLLHVKRARCRKCRQLISFKKKGKYGKLRKEIAFELTKDIQGDDL